jgi:hypothetical protein
MLEMLALAYFIKQIKKITEKKGIKPTKWIVTTVISWFAIEIIVFIIGFIVFDMNEDDILILMFPAIILATTSAFLILERLKKEPDLDPIENIGKEAI